MNILLVEDDESLCHEIKSVLSKWDMDVQIVENFDNVIQTFDTDKHDIILMDITLPKYDGFYWTRAIRRFSNVPIIFLSSRDNPMDQVMSMELGADDYIQKPFHMPILIAKIQAIYRRVHQYTNQASRTLLWHHCTVDLTKDCIYNNHTTVYLSKTEMLILEVLLNHRNQIVSRDALMTALWDDEAFVSDNTLTVNVNRLRKKLSDLQLELAIETKVGRGYIAHD
ncbi:DNA-binding response regulator [Staphylococcus felis]|uniref:response regulator transcription factor n=1 Tax=Staphylococcus felis TaxID=46127 RepID=UPI000E25249F|nr:response regulator transcription factor [Staphylococcus felis]REH96545.1 DNA-binding response regulator [Staphylococcus felis]REH98901.1 DNA-binding response regulator [Staphylococcus felis]REI03037.1 DNA-binding response regulator [Staphylococcus felis]REI06115.1 DNA-binding response regulator [Staphylococcus felis]REI12511.1 DNA-binding response regulator [Staphylococcus felis]